MVFWTRLRQRIGEYSARHTSYFILTIVILVMGIVFGALAVKALNSGQRNELWEYIRTFFDTIDAQRSVGSSVLFRQSITGHLRTLALIAVLGLSVIGSPLILLFLFTRGFIIGFSVGFLVQQMVFKGVLLSAVAVLPQNLLIVPALILASVAGLDFSIVLIRGRMGNRGFSSARELSGNALVVLGSCAVLMLAGFVEAYICPVFLEALGGLLI